MNERIIDS